MCVCVFVFVGHETKAMQNNSGPRYKRSKLERKLNIDIVWSVVLLLLMCLTAAVGRNTHTCTHTLTLIHTLYQLKQSFVKLFRVMLETLLFKKWLLLLLIRPWCVAEQPDGSDLYDLRRHTPSSCWLLHVLDHDHCSAGVFVTSAQIL